MLSFKNFLLREAFHGLPNIEVMSLKQFGKDYQSDSSVEEADDEKLLGIPHKVPSDAEIQDYLKRVMDGKKTSRDKYVMPYVHNKVLIQISGPSYVIDPTGNKAISTDGDKVIDVDDLKKQITQRPTRILSQNQKMLKSAGEEYVFFNFGIPALTGLAVDESTGKFVVVTTCPGAGQCKLFCYALKGGYVQYPASFLKQTRMLNYLLNDPSGFFSKLESELSAEQKKFSKKNVKIVVRWHDAGDFFSDQYREMFFDVVRKFPDIEFYAYTKLASGAMGDKPENFTINFSQGALRSQEKQVDTSKYKHSAVVPKELFSDLMSRVTKTGEDGKEVKSLKFTSPENEQKFKERLAKKYNIKPDSILTYDEMMKTPKSEKHKWNVIVVPGEGDVSATRKDVLGTYLLFH